MTEVTYYKGQDQRTLPSWSGYTPIKSSSNLFEIPMRDDNQTSGCVGSTALGYPCKPEGVKLDEGKPRIELVPPEFIFETAKVLTKGAAKYTDRNWENGISYSRVFGALMRHMWAWWKGDNLDPESGESHLAHAACCIAFLIAYESRTALKSFDDRPK